MTGAEQLKVMINSKGTEAKESKRELHCMLKAYIPYLEIQMNVCGIQWRASGLK